MKKSNRQASYKQRKQDKARSKAQKIKNRAIAKQDTIDHMRSGAASTSHLSFDNLFFEGYSLVELAINAWEDAALVKGDRKYVDDLAIGWSIQACMALEFAFKYHLTGRKHRKSSKKDWDALSQASRHTHSITTLVIQLENYNKPLFTKLVEYISINIHLLKDPNRATLNDVVRDIVFFEPTFRYQEYDSSLVRNTDSMVLLLVFFQDTFKSGDESMISKFEDILQIKDIIKV